MEISPIAADQMELYQSGDTYFGKALKISNQRFYILLNLSKLDGFLKKDEVKV